MEDIRVEMEDQMEDLMEDNREIIAFWGQNDQYGFFSQWFNSLFEFNNNIFCSLPNEIKNLNFCIEQKSALEKLYDKRYCNAEKFMMMGKAALFNDNNMINNIYNTTSPKLIKELGRKVLNFNKETWDAYCCDIVKIANYLKFKQNDELNFNIKNTKTSILVEASPYDKIWGVGIGPKDKRIKNIALWNGTNYLGECLMFVRNILMNENNN